MRGRNILWLSFVAILLGAMTMVPVGTSAANTKLYITPTIIPGPGETAYIDDTYDLAVNIQDVDDLWAVGLTIRFAPYVSVLGISEIYEETFLSENGFWPTFFTYTVDLFNGEAHVALLRIPNPEWPDERWGVSGSGTLLTFKLTVLEAGACPIELLDTVLIDNTGAQISHRATGSYFWGSWANLVRVEMLPGKTVYVGEKAYFYPKVKNNGNVPLYVRVRLDVDRLEDARRVVIRSGQSYAGGGLGEPLPYEYLYLDEFDEWYYEFSGDATNVLGEPDGLYIEGNENAQWASWFSFEDITLGDREIADINVEAYCRYPNGFTEAVDIDIYDLYDFNWWGSCWGTPTWGWHGTRWVGESVLSVNPSLADETTLNDIGLLLYNYHGDAPDVMQIDSVRIKVDFASIVPVIAPIFVVNPGETLELGVISWDATEDTVGTYTATATVEYSISLSHWNSWEAKQQSFKFKVLP